MPTAIQVCRQKLGQSAVGFRQIIVPVRFARAVSGAPVWDAPDPDDRGFALGSEGIWRITGVRGAVAGVPVSKTVRLKVLREDIDATAPIFVTSDQERAVVTPTTALPADGVFRVRVTGPILTAAKISARLGAANGPVLGEMLIHTMSLATVPLCCHLVTLNGPTTVNDSTGAVVPAATGRTQAIVQDLIRQVNGIWQPAGLYFNVVEWKNTVRTLTRTHGTITGAYQGCFGTDDSATHWHIQATELGQVARRAHAINIYFVRGSYNTDTLAYNNVRGVGTSVVSAGAYGVVVVDDSDANDLAHEIGHVLNLDFHGGGNIGHADDSSAGSNTRDNIWIRRRLLYSYNPYGPLNTTPGRRINVGYGNWVRGSMIAVKNLAGDPTDNEYSEARSRGVSALP